MLKPFADAVASKVVIISSAKDTDTLVELFFFLASLLSGLYGQLNQPAS